MDVKKKICIGSRESRLAVVQSGLVMDYICSRHPEVEVSLLTMKTTGDKILDRTLDKIGGKGLFVKELDRALLAKESDLSVHSLKDMPMEIPEELPIVAFSKREDPRDVLVLPEGQTELDIHRPIGCSSLRRKLQLEKLFPGVEIRPIRGNLQTRLRKLEEEGYGALVLAAAGIKRLGLEHRISRYFTTEEIIPAAGQGILAVQGRAGEDYSCLEGFGDADAAAEALAERAFVRRLDGGCSSPVAAHAKAGDGKITIRGLYYGEEEGRTCIGEICGEAAEAETLGIRLAERLLKEARGKVWLVGAGPGDPGLFTLKGRQVLAEAEVVVYDALVGQSILNLVPREAKCINVGKRASNHLMPQEEISRVLVREAKKGRRVVRLKGGDPFLFGRGGEELELLCAEGIPYEVVPGVTSAIAVPAYNGIPVTHRDYCSSLHIVTGHKRKGEAYNIDFDALVRTEGTLVFLMGVTALPDICGGLIAAGMDEDMPAAILQKGTTARQKRIVATVSTLEAEVKRQGIETPAIIVVGKVCALADGFAWAERRPLAGKRILVTRPKELSSVMADKLRRKGAEVLELPAIRTEAIVPNPQLSEALGRSADYDWLVFTSPTGVKVFFEQLKAERKDIRAFGQVKLAAIGSGTAKALEAVGLYVDLMPEVYDGEALGKAVAARAKAGDRVLIPRAKAGNPELAEGIRSVPGVTVDDVPTYDTIYENQTLINETLEFEQGQIDYAVFTSASTVKGFAGACPDLDFSRVKAVCIGRQTAAAAGEYGMQTWTAARATMDAVVEKLEELAAAEKEQM